MEQTQQYRQGDVLLERVEAIPDGAEVFDRDNGRIVLAYGEVTGHAHAIADPGANLVTVRLANGIATYLDAPEGATLTHEEHGSIPLPPGRYEVVRQREYAPGEIKRVAD